MNLVIPPAQAAAPHHAVSRLRLTRLAASAKPFVARGSGGGRCAGCRLVASHCVCALRPQVATLSALLAVQLANGFTYEGPGSVINISSLWLVLGAGWAMALERSWRAP